MSASSAPLKVTAGARRAAIILLALGEEASGPVLEHLEESAVRNLSLAMSELGVVTSDEISTVASDFLSNARDHTTMVGDHDRTEAFLRKTLPAEKADALIAEIRGRSKQDVWRKLSGVDSALLTAYLQGEHPQTAALILSRLPARVSAGILSGCDDKLATSILNRMLTLNAVPQQALEDIEKVLQDDFLSGPQKKEQDPHEALADIFNLLDRQAEKRLMGALESANALAAARIKEIMFTFDDVTKLSAANVQTLLRGLDRTILAQALKGAPEPLLNIFLENLSTRAAKILRDDIGALPPMRMKDVEQAQGKIVQAIKDLEATGEITIARAGGEEYI